MFKVLSRSLVLRAGARLAEGQVLNRVVRWTPEGYELEADLRHAELIIEQLELENSELQAGRHARGRHGRQVRGVGRRGRRAGGGETPAWGGYEIPGHWSPLQLPPAR